MKDLTLVIMAAGMGSRFGGLKQIEPVGPNGEFIIDYTIYDAIRAGFNKVVFIIKKEHYELFKETIGNRVSKYIDVTYDFQDINDIPENGFIPDDRVKPWGTAHAILCAKDKVKGNFIVLNADDFYGEDAFVTASSFFKEKDNNQLEYSVIGYKVGNTLSLNGLARRGICEVKNDYLTNLAECDIERKNNMIIAEPLDKSSSFEVKENDAVSMNMFGFTDNLFEYLENGFKVFFEELRNGKYDLLKGEYLIPDVVCKLIKKNIIKVKVVPTTSVWQGITYKEDKQLLVDEINKNIENGTYPEKLWD